MMNTKHHSAKEHLDGPHLGFMPETNPELLLPDLEPVKCKVFGCRHTLSAAEQLFGNICQMYSGHIYPDNFIGEFEWVETATHNESYQQAQTTIS